MKKTIEEIKVSEIFAHPNNPRLDLGDLSELAESIKANGILQNLTVIRGHYEADGSFVGGGYTTIIGHRRTAAAKVAGLETVSAVVCEMNKAEQIATMLAENVQRSDLTPYEQAQGFQMMLDLGETVTDIAQKSGFSVSTVRHRVKMLELDKDAFKEAEVRGGTLMDYMALEQIKDVELRNEVLKSIGTNNFDYMLKRAKDKEMQLEFQNECIALLDTFATRVESVGGKKYVNSYRVGDKLEKPADADTRGYYYTASSWGISLYADAVEKVLTPEELENQRKQQEAEDRYEQLEECSKRAGYLRKQFLREFHGEKANQLSLMQFAAEALLRQYSYSWKTPARRLCELLDLIPDCDNEEENEKAVNLLIQDRPLYAAMCAAYAKLDCGTASYVDKKWNREIQGFDAVWRDNDDLNTAYDFLCSIGYEMSDEELQLCDGSHSLFVKEEAEEAEEQTA